MTPPPAVCLDRRNVCTYVYAVAEPFAELISSGPLNRARPAFNFG